MKKILSVLFFSAVCSVGAMAQTADAAKPAMTKEQKEIAKRQKEEQTTAALKQAGLSDEQMNRAKVIMENTTAQNNRVKKDATLSEEQKKAALDQNKEEQKRMLTELMGADKYKIYSDAKKAQKAAAAEKAE